jgi:hypothetical protein
MPTGTGRKRVQHRSVWRISSCSLEHKQMATLSTLGFLLGLPEGCDHEQPLKHRTIGSQGAVETEGPGR